MADNKKVVTKKNTNKKGGAKRYTKSSIDFSGIRAGKNFEYKMSKGCAENILTDPITGKRLPGDPAKILCDFVNEQYGLLGTCVSVIVG